VLRVNGGGGYSSVVINPVDMELKFHSSSREEPQGEPWKISARVLEQIRAGVLQPGFAFVPIDSSLPRRQQEGFARVILTEPAP